MPGQTLYLTTYTYNSSENKFQYISLADEQWSTNDKKPVWTYLLPIIRKGIKHKFKQIKLYEDSEVYPLTEPQIILLFLESKELANPLFFDILAKGGGDDLRPHVAPEHRNYKIENGKIYHPIITIAEPDITYLYSEEKDAEGQSKWNGLIYSCLNLDKRFKILDSSIWHRYVPVDPYNDVCKDGDKEVKKGTFSDIFIDVLGDIVTYHRQGLYYTNASVISLEFQMRMLLHSYVGKFGDKGHSEVVTPFKFHSERQMAMKVKKEVAFLLEDWGEKGNNLLWALNWRFLIVDDQAKSQLSFIREEFAKSHKKLTKENLILQPLTKLYEENHLPVKEYILTHAKNKQSEYNIIDDAVNAISKFTFDIVFLDYLLGKNLTTQEREYGHEFLLKLLEDNRLDYPLFKRDFLGKYWVFPISSYPHALTDKLTQLGINYIHEIWYIAQGADPVSVPHLYAYNLFRFIKEKVGKFFLHPNALKRLINQTPIDYNMESYLWIDILQVVIKNGRDRFELLDNEQFNVKASRFVQSIKLFIGDLQNNIFEPMFEDMDRLLSLIKQRTADRDEKEIRVLMQKIKEDYPKFREGLQPLLARTDIILNHKHNEVTKIIRRAIKDKRTDLSLSGKGLKTLPEIIGEAQHIERLELRGNFLTMLPDYIEKLTKLKHIDLRDNKFSKLPEVLRSLTQLKVLLLDGNPSDFKPSVTKNNKDIHAMFDYQDAAEKRRVHSIIEKVEIAKDNRDITLIIKLLEQEQIKSILSKELLVKYTILCSQSQQYFDNVAYFYHPSDKMISEEKNGIINGFSRLLEQMKIEIQKLYP
jgi:hypothetical protein